MTAILFNAGTTSNEFIGSYGVITALAGLNGAGKTTHLRQLHAETGGSLLPDIPNIPIELCAIELLTRVAKMRKLPEAEERARKLCEALRIDGSFARSVSTYSAGNYKKTALATLLLQRPDNLYLDEPFEMLDVLSATVVKDLLVKLSSAGTNIVLTTQDVVSCLDYDHMKILVNCSVVTEGAPRDILGKDPWKQFLRITECTVDTSTLNWLW